MGSELEHCCVGGAPARAVLAPQIMASAATVDIFALIYFAVASECLHALAHSLRRWFLYEHRNVDDVVSTYPGHFRPRRINQDVHV